MGTSGNCLKIFIWVCKVLTSSSMQGNALYCINQCLLQRGKCVRSGKSSRKIWRSFENTSARMQLQKICRDDVLINIIKKLNRCVRSGMENWTVCAVLLLTSNRFIYDGVHCLAEFPSQAYWNAFEKFIVNKNSAAFNPSKFNWRIMCWHISSTFQDGNCVA